MEVQSRPNTQDENPWRLAMQAYGQGRLDECLSWLEPMLGTARDGAGLKTQRRIHALNLYGAAQYARRGWDEASRAWELALTLMGPSAESQSDAALRASLLNNLGNVLTDQGRLSNANAAFEQSIRLVSNDAGAHANHAQCLELLHRHDAALASVQQACRLQPGSAECHYLHGVFLVNRQRFGEADQAFAKAAELDGQHGRAQVNRGVMHLSLGRWEPGWSGYVWRPTRNLFWLHPRSGERVPVSDPRRGPGSEAENRQAWRDQLQGQRILAVAEQGLGDELFFLRFVLTARAQGQDIRYAPSARLAPLLRARLPQCIWHSDAGDGWVPQALVSVGDMPLLLDSVTTVPGPVRLWPDPGRQARLREWLAEAGPGPYLGVNWLGGGRGSDLASVRYKPLLKSIDPAALGAALRDWPGTVVVLQRRPEGQEVAEFTAALQGVPVGDACDVPEDLEELLALLSLLDQYAGTSSTTMHLLSALGRTAQVLVPHPPEWRWMAQGTQSPWFAGFGIHRQTPEGHWAPGLASMRQALGMAGRDRLALTPAEVMGAKTGALTDGLPPVNWSRARPSPRYGNLLSQYRQLHLQGEAALQLSADQTFSGSSLQPHLKAIRAMAKTLQAQTLLDYGCGKAQLHRQRPLRLGEEGDFFDLASYWGVDRIALYDPAVAAYASLPQDQFDLVICTDVLEHCPREDLPWIMDELFAKARLGVFANIACYPARKTLPTGENAHCTVEPIWWWTERIAEACMRYPKVRCQISMVTLEPNPDGSFANKVVTVSNFKMAE